MINVRGIANAAIQPVNPNISAQYRASIGYTISAAGKQTPDYAADVPIRIQAQAVKGKDLEHVNNLNLEAIYKNVRMWGNAQGVERPRAKGGDLLVLPNVPGETAQTWLVVAVLETWPDWCSVIACMQTDPVSP